MLKFFANLFRKKAKLEPIQLLYPEGRRYYKDSHPIRKSDIDPDALKIIHRLNKFGYKAYLVGGGVRDMLIGRKPKDFDVVTNATPTQIRKIFNNCRIIGKRFKLVHILFRGKVIEVSTFRSLPEHRKENVKKVKNKDLLIKKDNIYGSPKEDAARRDFTINSLYFDPRNESIIDYVGGFEDIQNKIIRVIGDPDVSFKEDPVRMLRAVKFSVLLGFEIEKKTKQAIKRNRLEIRKAAPARMLEEYNKIIRTWKTAPIFQALAENHLLDIMIPEPFEKDKKNSEWPSEFLNTNIGKRLATIDKLLAEREQITPCIFYAILSYDLVRDAIEGKKGNIAHNVKVSLEPFCKSLGIPKKEKDKLIKIFTSQNRFYQTEEEKADQNAFFKKKDFFYDAFMVFKIIAISSGDDRALQAAFFWEISPRQRPIKDNKDSQYRTNRNRVYDSNKKNGQNKKFKNQEVPVEEQTEENLETNSAEPTNQNTQNQNWETAKEDNSHSID